MHNLSELIEAYRIADGDAYSVASWWAIHLPSPPELVALAERLGSLYTTGAISYPVANGLMNQLMPLAGWEDAPQRFWDYYLAFEDAEAFEDPDSRAKLAVLAVANAGAA